MPNMYKFVTVKANAKKIILWKFIWCQICTKLLLWRQMLRKSSLWKCMCACQICTKSLLCMQMLRKFLLDKCIWHAKYVQNCYFEGKCKGNHHLKMHLAPNMCKIITLKANAKKIITVKMLLMSNLYKMLLWRQMLRKSSLLNAFGTRYVQNSYLKANVQDIVTWKCMWHQICTKPLLWRQMLRISLL